MKNDVSNKVLEDFKQSDLFCRWLEQNHLSLADAVELQMGNTNLCFRLIIKQHQITQAEPHNYYLRIFNQAALSQKQRAQELVVQNQSAQFGISIKPLLGCKAWQLFEWCDNHKPQFDIQLSDLARLSALTHHQINSNCPNRLFQLVEFIRQEYEQLPETHQRSLSSSFDVVEPLAKKVIRMPFWQDNVQCHGDLSFENVLYQAGSAYLTDWEFCCRAPFQYDLAVAITLNKLDNEQQLQFATYYLAQCRTSSLSSSKDSVENEVNALLQQLAILAPISDFLIQIWQLKRA